MSERWGPLERRRYLDALDQDAVRGPTDRGVSGTPSVFTEVAEAERLVAACERDWDQAVVALRATRADAGPDADLAHSRHLLPAERTRLVHFYQAQEGERLAAQAYQQARERLNAALARLDQLARPDLGLAPSPEW